jgi:hypothetical protein
VDPVPDPLLLQNLIVAGNEPGTSGSVARNSDHYTTDAVMERRYLSRIPQLGLSLIVLKYHLKKETYWHCWQEEANSV